MRGEVVDAGGHRQDGGLDAAELVVRVAALAGDVARASAMRGLTRKAGVERAARCSRRGGRAGYGRPMGLKARKPSSGRTEAKTKPTKVSAQSFVDGLDDERRRREAKTLISMMKKLTGEKPVMWGPSIVGFGSYHYKYASGREGDAPRAGSPVEGRAHGVLRSRLRRATRSPPSAGPHTTSVSCLYIRKLEEIDLDVLRELIERSVDQMRRKFPA